MANTPAVRSTRQPIDKVLIRDGKTIRIDDYIYISSPWTAGSGDPYLIGRVMEFVTAESSRSGAAALASTSGVLHVRANVFLRSRDISQRAASDPRLLVATFSADVYALSNVRGLCEVRHRDLIGEAPEIAAWKKNDDHFYYYQLYDRYIHRMYDVVPTAKLQNAPPDVLIALRKMYSFIVAEPGISSDLCDSLRGCAVCSQWAPVPESVRCDTCRKFFHMACLNPPLSSKPAKGYSWTCAPCSRQREQQVALELGSRPTTPVGSMGVRNGAALFVEGNGAPGTAANAQSTGSESAAGALSGVISQVARGRGRPRGSTTRKLIDGETSLTATPDGTPGPEKTTADARGLRCTDGWPYRYFGQLTDALDVLDPHDSIYPRASTRLGTKFQASLPTWEEQKAAGLGTVLGVQPESSMTSEDMAAAAARKPKAKGRGGKTKAGAASERGAAAGTSTSENLAIFNSLEANAAQEGLALTVAPVVDFERGTDDSVEVLSSISTLDPSEPEGKIGLLEAYLSSAAYHFNPLPSFNVDFLNHALKIYSQPDMEPISALQAVSRSSAEDFRIVHWSQKERRIFEQNVRDFGAEMRQLKKLLPQKKYFEIVRFFAQWKNDRLQEQHQAAKATKNGKNETAADSKVATPAALRAVSPTVSLFADAAVKASPNVACKMCSTTDSSVWYKGPWAWTNRFLCSNCGLYWRKYAAEAVNTDLVAINPKKAVGDAPTVPGLGVIAPSTKSTRASRLAGDASKTGTPSVGTANTAASASSSSRASVKAVTPPQVFAKPDPIRCVMCKRLEPKKKLQQCHQCSLSVHQGCFGLSNEEVAADIWTCHACSNEQSLDYALNTHCVLCPEPHPQEHSGPSAPRSSATNDAKGLSSGKGRKGRPSAAAANGIMVSAEPLTALDAVKPTESNNWAHLVCATWIPEIQVTDGISMKLVEGAGNLPFWRYSQTCELCSRAGGAVVQCSEVGCRRTYHVSCGFQNTQYYFGFEIHPVKTSRRDAVTTATFKNETGHWTAVTGCEAHKESVMAKITHDFSETFNGLTALQIYMRTHKSVTPMTDGAVATSAASDPTYALLRRAKRYDTLLTEIVNASKTLLTAGNGQTINGSDSVSPPPPASLGKQTATSAHLSSAPAGVVAAAPSPQGSKRQGLAHTNGDAARQVNGSHAGSARIFKTSPSPDLSFKDTHSIPGHRGKVQKTGKECLRCASAFSPMWWDVPIGQVVTRTISPPQRETERQISSTEDSHVVCNACRGVVLDTADPTVMAEAARKATTMKSQWTDGWLDESDLDLWD